MNGSNNTIIIYLAEVIKVVLSVDPSVTGISFQTVRSILDVSHVDPLAVIKCSFEQLSCVYRFQQSSRYSR